MIDEVIHVRRWRKVPTKRMVQQCDIRQLHTATCDMYFQDILYASAETLQCAAVPESSALLSVNNDISVAACLLPCVPSRLEPEMGCNG